MKLLRPLVALLCLTPSLALAAGASLPPPAKPLSYVRSVGTRAGQAAFNNNSSLIYANGNTLTWFRSKLQVVNGPQAITDISVAFSNFLFARPEADTPNPLPITSALIEYPAGVFTPLFFNGSLSVTISPGGIVHSDPSTPGGIGIPAGATYWIRVGATVTAGQSWPITRGMNVTFGDRGDWGTGTSPALTANIGGGNSLFYIPYEISARIKSPQPSVFIIGDSRGTAIADTGDVNGYNGYFERAFANNFGWLNKSVSGDFIASYLANNYRSMQAVGGRFTHIVDELGINDIGQGQTLAQIQANKIALWTLAKNRGMKVWATTLEPYTSGTFTTAAGQTPAANTGPNSIRTQLNDWIRSGAGGMLDGYWDVADAVETSRNSGIWASPGGVALTNDGLHANAAGNLAAKTAINPAQIVATQ